MGYQFNLISGIGIDDCVNGLICVEKDNYKRLSKMIESAAGKCNFNVMIRVTEKLKESMMNNGVFLDYEPYPVDLMLSVMETRKAALKAKNMRTIEKMRGTDPYIYFVDVESFKKILESDSNFFRSNRAVGIHVVVVASEEEVKSIESEIGRLQYQVTIKDNEAVVRLWK